MRALEQRCAYPQSDGFVMYDEWHPYNEIDTYGWRDKDFAEFVREENKRRKLRGDNVRLRSVYVDREY